MEAWKAKGTSVALAAMGLVTTLVGMALVESAAAASASGARELPPLSGGFAHGFGQLAIFGGAALLLAAIVSWVLATRRGAPVDAAFASESSP